MNKRILFCLIFSMLFCISSDCYARKNDSPIGDALGKIVVGIFKIIKKDYERDPEKYRELAREGAKKAYDYFTEDSKEAPKIQLKNIEIKQLNQDILDLIPEDTDCIVHINASKILAVPEVQKQITEEFEKQPEQKKVYEELKSKSGFDPLKDLSNITLFSSGKAFDGQETIGGFLIKGNFDVKKIVKVIQDDEEASKGVDVKTVDGYYCIVPQNNKDGYGMFLDNQYAVLGSQLGVNAVKAVANGKAKPVKHSVFKQINSNATISGAGILPQAFKDKCTQNPNAAALANINTFYFDFNNDDNMILNLNAEVDKANNVNDVLTQVNGYIAMIKMFAGQIGPEMAEAANMITVTNNGTTIKLNLNIPAAKVAEIKAKLQERAKQMQESSNGARQ